MAAVEKLITDNLDIWSSAVKAKSAAGRGTSKKLDLYGIKKLRELILELAVRGLLVPQDLSDEPASELLKKIAAEKAKLIKEGKIKKQKPLPPITDDEKPFEPPERWAWVRLGDATNYGSADKVEAKDVNSNTWILELEDVEKTTSKLLAKVRFEEREFRSSKNRFYSGDVIYGKLRPYLDKVLVADEDGVCTTEMIPVKAYACILPMYLRVVMKSPYFIQYADNSTHGMNLPRMGTDKARLALIPVLSEAEQHRIVAKVDELMALCDQLEQQTEASISAHQTLVQTLLGALTNASQRNGLTVKNDAPNTKESRNAVPEATGAKAKNTEAIFGTNEAWPIIAEHFDTLFTTEWSIDQLKQTILQLAVMGKLVPQNPNDEPASELLKKIAAKKVNLIKEGKIKKQKPLPPISDDEKPFELPNGWEWSRLGELVSIRGGKRVSNGYKLLTEPTPYIYIRVSDMKNGSIDDSNLHYIDSDMRNKISQYIITKDDLYMTIVGATIGKCGLVPDKFDQMNLTENAARLSPFGGISKQYLHKLLESVFCQEQFIDKTKQVGVQKMALNRLSTTMIPLPPIAEQNTILTKVDELMSLCDTLKKQVNTAQITQLQLADAMAEQALN